MSLDFSRCRLPPFQHQREDVEWLLDRRYAFIASEMRTGKTKTVVDAAQFLFERDLVHKVIVVVPAAVRSVWYDPDFGEIAKHRWRTTSVTAAEFHSRVRVWSHLNSGSPTMFWYVTNFEYLRSATNMKMIAEACGPRTLLVGDESSFLKNWKSQQTKAFVALRKLCGWCWLLNGTPIFHSPLDLFAQANILSPTILDCQFVTKYKARYAIQQPVLERGKPMIRYGKIVQEVADWTNLDDIERRLKPYTVRRLQAECLDLPPKIDPVTLTATLKESWPAYKQMRDDMVVWLSASKVVNSKTAAIKTLRLSQITGGFLKGSEEAYLDEPTITGPAVEWDDVFGDDDATLFDAPDGGSPLLDLPGAEGDQGSGRADGQDERRDSYRRGGSDEAVELGREKLEILLWLIESLLEKDPNLHLVAWSRFRPEAFRAEAEVKRKFPQFTTGLVLGGQRAADRKNALALLHPETSPKGPVFLSGIEGTGSFGLNMTAAHTCVTMSSGYSPGRSAQTLDRVYGPGQTHPIAYYNIIAVGPKGQRTIDHDILLTRTTGENIALRTAAAWLKALKGYE